MKESALVRRILRELNAVPGCKAAKLHGGPYMQAGMPDVFGCYNGRAFLVEVKVEGRMLSPIQSLRFFEWLAAGAPVVVAREDFDAREFIKKMEAKGE